MKNVDSTDSSTSLLLAAWGAIDRVQAIIRFDLGGTVIDANANFLKLFGFEREDLLGKHHRMLCVASFAESAEYEAFWNRLRAGEAFSAEYKRIGKDGREIWLQASYHPILGADGAPTSVMKSAMDVTAARKLSAEARSKIEAIERSQAVVEFSLDGKILTANPNFLQIFGYSLADLQGKPHQVLCPPGVAQSASYAAFWQKLRQGEFVAGEFRRVASDGRAVWLHASYNPIFDADGKLVKVVKFASDITENVEALSRERLEMSTPVTEVWDGVLLAPIVGMLDSKRSTEVMNRALSSIVKHRAATLVLDITGVTVVDTAVASHLIKVAKAAALLGCRAILTGVSPAIAQTMVGLGIDLGSVQTTSTIKSALRGLIESRRGPVAAAS